VSKRDTEEGMADRERRSSPSTVAIDDNANMNAGNPAIRETGWEAR
jgi:hypothetical protein